MEKETKSAAPTTEAEEIEARNQAVQKRLDDDDRRKADEARRALERAAEAQIQMERRKVRMEAGFRIASNAIALVAIIAAMAVFSTADLMHRDLALLIQALAAVAAAGRIGFLAAVIKFV